MTNFQQRLAALRGSAFPKKAIELFYVSHPKAERALLGPFLGQADAAKIISKQLFSTRYVTPPAKKQFLDFGHAGIQFLFFQCSQGPSLGKRYYAHMHSRFMLEEPP